MIPNERRRERFARALDVLQPRDDADRRGLSQWLRAIVRDYRQLRDRIERHPSAKELRDELLELATTSRRLADMLRRLSEPAGERLQHPLRRSGTRLDRPREFFGSWHDSPVNRVKQRIGASRHTGEGLWFDVRALAALAEREAKGISVSRQSRREQVAGFGDTRRDLVVACGNIIFARGVEVRAAPLAMLVESLHEQVAAWNGDEDRAAIARHSAEVANAYERLRAEYDLHTMIGLVQRPEMRSLATGFGFPAMELHRKLRLIIGLPPEGERVLEQ